jgi:hypothetical protein
MPEAEHIAIKRFGPIHIGNRQRDLADAVRGKRHG